MQVVLGINGGKHVLTKKISSWEIVMLDNVKKFVEKAHTQNIVPP